MVSAVRSLLFRLSLLGFLLFSGSAGAATFSATLDRTTLALDETTTLTLRYEGQALGSRPDLSALEPFFDVLGSSQSRQIRSINGRTESFTQWQYQLAPKQAGRIRIPPLSLDGNRSQAIEVSVTQPRLDPSTPGGDYFLERELIPQGPLYPGQQLLVRLKLNTAVNLSELQITPLTVDGAKLIELEDRQYQRNRNGRTYLVHEKSYALFPAAPGTLQLPAQRLNAVKGGNRSLFGSRGGQRVRLQVAAQSVDIQPAPLRTDKVWLPADDLRVTQRIESSTNEIKVGEPLTLLLNLEASGADPARLPALESPQNPALKQYPEPTQDSQQQDSRGIFLQRSRRIALVPTQAGQLTLPPFTVDWWDTQARQWRKAQTQPLTLTVQPAPAAQSPAPQQPLEPIQADPVASPAAAKPAAQSPPQTEPDATDNTRWLLLSNLAWALVSLGLALGWWRARRPVSATAAQPQGASHPPVTAKLDQALTQACQQGEPATIRQAILAWATGHQLCHPRPATLEEIADIGSDALRKELAALDQALFANAPAADIDAGQLLQALKQLQHQLRKSDEQQPHDLPPLYAANQ